MSLRPDSNSVRKRSKSRTRDGSRSPSHTRLPSTIPQATPPTNGLPYPTEDSLGVPFPPGPSDLNMGDFTDFPSEERAALRAAALKSQDSFDRDLTYGTLPTPGPVRQHSSSSSGQHSFDPKVHEHATPSENRVYAYMSKPTHSLSPRSSPSAPLSYSTPFPSSYDAKIVEITPGTSTKLAPRMDRLTVSGGSPHDLSRALPPPSPLLEPYRGTYQSISPMASPMMYPQDADLDEVPSLSQLSLSTSSKHRKSSHKHTKSDSSRHRKSALASRDIEKDLKKRVKLYDAQEDAQVINEALSHHRGPDPDPICDVLPHLTHDQVLELRSEYKRIATVGINGRGINMAKHLKMKLSGNFGKVAYVTALGRWESDAYWTQFSYQSSGSRRELLIESLIGRSNADIREIKNSFKDKRYRDDLVSCMEAELKADKFRVAILTALDGGKQEETEVYPRQYIDKDVSVLRRCIVEKEGGESTILDIIIRRSDAHLREVLRTYERQYGTNFAREALKKSNNLVVSARPCRNICTSVWFLCTPVWFRIPCHHDSSYQGY